MCGERGNTGTGFMIHRCRMAGSRGQGKMAKEVTRGVNFMTH